MVVFLGAVLITAILLLDIFHLLLNPKFATNTLNLFCSVRQRQRKKRFITFAPAPS
jgi:hypothetical protein